MDIHFFILLIFTLCCIIHLLFTCFLFNLRATTPLTVNEIKLSEDCLTILICARNEATHLKKNIPFFCEQAHQNLEVIVVNHKSSDDSRTILSEFSKKYTWLKIVNCDEDNPMLPGKRSAIYAGLATATGSYILMTDADCQPTSDQWATLMMARAEVANADVVLGIGTYDIRKSWLNRFIQFETFHTAMLYMSLAQKKWPYMGVGRNLLVKKDVLESRLKQSVVPGILSGDDDLLIANLSFTHKITVETHQNARTVSTPKVNWTSYFRQKMRHLSTANYYRDNHRWVLQFFHGSQALLLVAFVILLCGPYYKTAIGIFVLRYLVLMLDLYRKKQVLKMNVKPVFYPIMEVVLLGVPVISMIANRLIKSNEWS